MEHDSPSRQTMTSDTAKNRLLEEFRHYLENADLAQMRRDEQPDLNTLLVELAGLKSEVKTEARHFKTTLDTLNSALSTVQADNKAMGEELAGVPARLERQRQEILRTLLLDAVELYDRLTDGFEVLDNYRPVASLFSHSKKQDVRFIDNFKTGQAIILKRFEQFLQRHRVRPMDCVGEILDPCTMNAVDIGRDENLGNGVVMEELRKGYWVDDQVLRPADVKVNKL